ALPKQTTSKLLISEPPLQVLPSLAVCIGLNEAILVQQIHYMLTTTNMGEFHNDKKWLYLSYKDFDRIFPFIKKGARQRALSNLKALNLLLVDSFNELKGDKTLWYSIDYEALNKIDGIQKVQRTPPSAHNGRKGGASAQNGPTDDPKW